MANLLRNAILLATLVLHCSTGSPYHDPHFIGDRRVIAQLMDWKFSEIAKECEIFLGPNGYGGVQTSPIGAHAVILVPFRNWSERYAPTAYKIISRSGNEADFADMVDRCNRAGVRVYVDIVLNHMTGPGTGTGTDGSNYDGDKLEFPGAGFYSDSFHGHESCPTADLEIADYDDPTQVRNCRLGTLRDLNQFRDNVRNEQRKFVNRIIDIGVAGFRSDASKHMWPSDLEAIYFQAHDLNTKYFPAGSRPFIAHEYHSAGPRVPASDYLSLGRIIEFRFSEYLAVVLRKRNNQNLKMLSNLGEDWGLVKSSDALSMIDTHDLQRESPGTNINYFEPRLLKIATAYMLAFPYGVTRVMSSYYWPRDIQNGKDVNSYYGPPNVNGVIKDVTRNADGSCDNRDWICEHRWQEIAGMVRFRNTAGDEPLTNWWDNGNNAIAFGRGNKAFIVINNDDSVVDNWFQTGLPSGQYCDVFSGKLLNGKCTGSVIKVESDGKAPIRIDNNSDYPIVAIHVGEKL